MSGAVRFRLFVMTSLAIVAVLLGVVIVRQLTGSRETTSDRVFRETRPLVAAFRMRDLSSRDDVLAALQELDTGGLQEVTFRQREALAALIAEFVVRYHLDDDPDAYMAWRDSSPGVERNAELLTESSMARRDLLEVLRVHGSDVGIVDQLSSDFAALFRMNWNVRRGIAGGANVVTAICESRDGVTAHAVRATQSGFAWPALDDSGGGAAFAGGSSAGARRWFHEVPTVNSLLAEGLEVLGVRVSIFFEFADDLRRPIHFLMYWDDRSERWRVEDIVQTNVPDAHHTWAWDI